jgi:hypothetical protein
VSRQLQKSNPPAYPQNYPYRSIALLSDDRNHTEPGSLGHLFLRAIFSITVASLRPLIIPAGSSRLPGLGIPGQPPFAALRRRSPVGSGRVVETLANSAHCPSGVSSPKEAIVRIATVVNLESDVGIERGFLSPPRL